MKLLSMLIDRFNLTPPDGASQMDVEFQTKFSGAVKLRFYLFFFLEIKNIKFFFKKKEL